MSSPHLTCRQILDAAERVLALPEAERPTDLPSEVAQFVRYLPQLSVRREAAINANVACLRRLPERERDSALARLAPDRRQAVTARLIWGRDKRSSPHRMATGHKTISDHTVLFSVCDAVQHDQGSVGGAVCPGADTAA